VMAACQSGLRMRAMSKSTCVWSVVQHRGNASIMCRCHGWKSGGEDEQEVIKFTSSSRLRRLCFVKGFCVMCLLHHKRSVNVALTVFW
jgi:hypothetical protein